MAAADGRLRALETRLAKDRGYSGESPAKEGLGGFVCPRANAYGGREGIIAPGVAAQHGLVPRGMRHIDVADTVRSAVAASRDGQTEADRYRAYYGNTGNAPAASLKQEQEERDIQTTVQTVQTVQERPALHPPVRTPAALVPPSGRDRKGRFTKIAANPVEKRTKQAKTATIRQKEDVFDAVSAHPADDTLEGFYDDLAHAGVRTTSVVRPHLEGVEIAGEDGSRTVRLGAGDGPEGPGLRVTEVPPSRSEEPDVTGVLTLDDPPDSHRELDILRQSVARTEEALARERQRADALTAERDALAREVDTLARQLKESAPLEEEQVRVVLSKEEERLRIGGKGWDVKLVGALHWSRSARTLVLTVSDTAYASELLSELRPGPVVLLSADRRSSCVYAGNCAKIYGESESPDFIGVFRFTVNESSPLETD